WQEWELCRDVYEDQRPVAPGSDYVATGDGPRRGLRGASIEHPYRRWFADTNGHGDVYVSFRLVIEPGGPEWSEAVAADTRQWAEDLAAHEAGFFDALTVRPYAMYDMPRLRVWADAVREVTAAVDDLEVECD